MPRVTVVNDDPEFLDLVGDILEGDRYEATLVDGDGADALQRIRDSDPQLLMIDLRIGSDGLHGWTIVEQIRADAAFADVPILVCSADVIALAEIEADLERARPVETLTKPFGIDELLDVVDRLLDATPA